MDEHEPPRAFVIGRVEEQAWIADVVPDYEAGELTTSIAWDAREIDPLGCSLLLRSEKDGLPLLMRQVRISDVPPRADKGKPPEESIEPWALPWSERLLSVALPRGPRRTDFGISLFASDGRLLDEWPVVARVEQLTMALHIDGATEPSSVSVVGDRENPPTPSERDEAVIATETLEAESRQAAATRRFSTAGELAAYLKWRLCSRAGELLILDPYLASGDAEPVIDFLRELNRPVRALVASISPVTTTVLQAVPEIDFKLLPHGKSTLHDRVWLVGETGLLLGGSLNTSLQTASKSSTAATTATELPYGDAARWRDQFESWWPR
jgi:hypothetical protein